MKTYKILVNEKVDIKVLLNDVMKVILYIEFPAFKENNIFKLGSGFRLHYYFFTSSCEFKFYVLFCFVLFHVYHRTQLYLYNTRVQREPLLLPHSKMKKIFTGMFSQRPVVEKHRLHRSVTPPHFSR